MGSKEIGVLLIFFSYLYILATSSPLHKALPSSDSLQETHFAHRHDSSYVGDSGRSSIKHSSKFEHAFGSGTANGGGGSAGTGQNGGTRSPAQGGGNFIPVYAAGAANNRHQNHHHGSGNCNRNRNSIGLSTLVVGTLASLIAYL
ncbi:hypothetical protein FCV25MIE_18685 [Fagus crenata]